MNEGKKSYRMPRRVIRAKGSTIQSVKPGTAPSMPKRRAKKKSGYFEHLNNVLNSQLNEIQDRMAGVGMGNYMVDDDNYGEYSDEVGMVETNMATMLHAIKELNEILKKNENIPEWVQEKIAQAKGMLVAAKDYMLSQHAQGNVQYNEVSELTNWEYLGKVDKSIKDLGDKAQQTDDPDEARRLANKAVNRTQYADKISRKMTRKSSTKEGWTHDTLAAKLFEQDLTYEDHLARELKRKLQK